MKITIITVCLNAAETIDDCLLSVAEQSYPNIEHIVIDGRSSDGTLSRVRRFSHVSKLVSEPDRGLYDAMNKGLKQATGEYVLFLNADDRLYNSAAIAETVSEINLKPGADIYYGSLEVRPLLGKPSVFHPPPPEDVAEFLICHCLPHQSTLARLSVFEKTGPFNLDYKWHAEYDWFTKVFADQSIKIQSVPNVIGSFKEGGASSQLEKGQPEVFIIQNKAALYAGKDWDKIRISALQNAWLNQRIECAGLKDKINRRRSRILKILRPVQKISDLISKKRRA